MRTLAIALLVLLVLPGLASAGLKRPTSRAASDAARQLLTEADAARKAGTSARAIELYGKALEADPGFPNAVNALGGRGQLLAGADRCPEAALDFARVTENPPADLDAYDPP